MQVKTVLSLLLLTIAAPLGQGIPPAAADPAPAAPGAKAPGAAAAAHPTPASPTPAIPAATEPAIGTRGVYFDPAHSPFDADLHARVVQVIDECYNFEFSSAEKKAQAIQRDYRQEHPIGPFLLSEIFFWQAINNRDRPELAERFQTEAREVAAACERRLAEDEREPLALFMLGGVYGREAILDGLNGHRFESVNTSVKARKHLKLLNRYHPEVEDAYLGLGIYDYFSAQLPWFARILSKLLLGLGGDRARGIAELERAAQHGLFTQVEARIILAIAYLDTEDRAPEALAILKELNTRYPKNLDFYGMLAFAYRTQHDYANAIVMLESLVSGAENEPAFGRQSKEMSAYFLASTCKVAGRYDQALPLLDRILVDPNPKSEWLTVLSLLERGRILDIQGRRPKASDDYREVLALRDFRGSHIKAKGYLANPYEVSAEERSRHLAPGTTGATWSGGQPPEGDGLDGVVSGRSNTTEP
jgi:tetratricopeptide (TPR) repeat protein